MTTNRSHATKVDDFDDLATIQQLLEEPITVKKIDGKQQKMTTRSAILKVILKQALQQNNRAAAKLLLDLQDAYPSVKAELERQAASGPHSGVVEYPFGLSGEELERWVASHLK